MAPWKPARLFAPLGLIAPLIAVAVGQQPPATAVYTAAQATAGRASYETSCAACHGADLCGTSNAPQLTGGVFLEAWRVRTTADLLSYAQTTMPADNPGNLRQADYINIVAYILQTNGASPGSEALTPAVAVPIGTIASTRAASATPAASAAPCAR
jgi:S-disulfanyl-L-cysteine oxidoreductase SoxD